MDWWLFIFFEMVLLRMSLLFAQMTKAFKKRENLILVLGYLKTMLWGILRPQKARFAGSWGKMTTCLMNNIFVVRYILTVNRQFYSLSTWLHIYQYCWCFVSSKWRIFFLKSIIKSDLLLLKTSVSIILLYMKEARFRLGVIFNRSEISNRTNVLTCTHVCVVVKDCNDLNDFVRIFKYFHMCSLCSRIHVYIAMYCIHIHVINYIHYTKICFVPLNFMFVISKFIVSIFYSITF